MILLLLVSLWTRGVSAQGLATDTTIVAVLGGGVGVTVPSGLALDYHRLVVVVVPYLRSAIAQLQSLAAEDSVLIAAQARQLDMHVRQSVSQEAQESLLRAQVQEWRTLSDASHKAYLRERRLRRITIAAGVVAALVTAAL